MQQQEEVGEGAPFAARDVAASGSRHRRGGEVGGGGGVNDGLSAVNASEEGAAEQRGGAPGASAQSMVREAFDAGGDQDDDLVDV